MEGGGEEARQLNRGVTHEMVTSVSALTFTYGHEVWE